MAIAYEVRSFAIYGGEQSHSDTAVLFPAIEGVGAYPDTNNNLQIPGEKIWVVGDLSGSFRGIIPAMLSGAYVAHYLLSL